MDASPWQELTSSHARPADPGATPRWTAARCAIALQKDGGGDGRWRARVGGELEERARPTRIRTTRAQDVKTKGLVWID